MDHLSTEERQRLRALAESLDCITDEDLQLLAGAEPGTTKTWRKRGEGPAYILIGNRYLYPRRAVAEFMQSKVRERRAVQAKALL